MPIGYTNGFKKKYRKMTLGFKKRFSQKLELFKEDQFDEILNNHKLHGKYKECRSINITGDIRAIYYINKQKTIIFITIGSHSELYE